MRDRANQIETKTFNPMKKHLAILFVIFATIIQSCGNSTTQQENDISQILKDFPLSWERFGIEDGDTVTYKFCYSSNPEFTLAEDFESIYIALGNEFQTSFEIAEISYTDSTLYFKFKKERFGLEGCLFKWVDKKQGIGAFFLYDNSDWIVCLPKERLLNKRRLGEECYYDDEDSEEEENE
jgi:hypothetical protein